jgi:hypothetical protein
MKREFIRFIAGLPDSGLRLRQTNVARADPNLSCEHAAASGILWTSLEFLLGDAS